MGILEGTIRGRNCKGVGGALVEVWYAGGQPGNSGYTFPANSTELWYRGMVKATYPRRYEVRPIIHYHYKVTSGSGSRVKTLTTQAYFRDGVPATKYFEDYVRPRDSQFPMVQQIPEGRRITYNIRLEF